VLIYGNLGMPALGVEGSAWATTAARVYMAVFLYLAIRAEHQRRGRRPGLALPFDYRSGHPERSRGVWTRRTGGSKEQDPPYVSPNLGFDQARIRRLVALGFPAASQVALEVGVFAVATALAGRLDPVSSGSHQIALNLASLAFMVPLGLSSAAAVRVGYAFGAGDRPRAALAGWTALASGCVIMTAIGVVFFLWPVPLLRAFSSDPRMIDIGVGLLAIAAAFQLFDGTQAVATGALRGISETRMPMLVNVIGHWFLGLPVGYLLCFRRGWGVAGLWVGLSIGLVLAALVLTVVWWNRSLTLVMQHAECKMQE
jgi:MATE family multidrug resistance protein